MILEAKARLEDEVESLQSKAAMMGQRCFLIFHVLWAFLVCVCVCDILLSLYPRGPQGRGCFSKGTSRVPKLSKLWPSVCVSLGTAFHSPPLCSSFAPCPQEHEEDQRRVQELLEQNAQLELEMQRW